MPTIHVKVSHDYGGKKGDESKSRRDYMGKSKKTAKKKTSSRKARSYGGKKGDESKSRRDYMSKRR